MQDAKTDLAACESMQDDLASLEQWAAIFKEPVQLAKTLATHYLLHERAIKADISAMEADWAVGSDF